MPVSSKTLIHLLIFQLLTGTCLHAQRLNDLPHYKKLSSSQKQLLDQSFAAETDCSNGLDDNGNGLTDLNDSHCYFYQDSVNYTDCQFTPILWASSILGIHWKNLATNEERLFSPVDNALFIDIAWSPNGKLYGIDFSGEIFEIDPLTWEHTPIVYVSGANGMTADNTGMLYVTVVKGESCDLYSVDPDTFESEKIVSLSNYGLLAAGDCCFLNGYIYVTCNGYIARIDIKTKLLEKLQIDRFDLYNSYALTTLGDGYLYITDNGANIYRVDPGTMTTELAGKFEALGITTFGYTSYAEACSAPCTKPRVSLGPDTVICNNSTLVLNALSDRSVLSFQWSNGANKKTNIISTPGVYSIKVDNICDSDFDTVVVIGADKPALTLQNDTLICDFTSITLRNLQATQESDRYLWSDNSALPTITVRNPGKYWLAISNACGIVADTVHVYPKIDNCECHVYTPNAFSPNNDQVNDVFQLASNCKVEGSIRIFNRWGQQVYKSENLDVGWNGFLGGQLQPEGLYVFTLQFNYSDRPGIFTRKGAFTLVR